MLSRLRRSRGKPAAEDSSGTPSSRSPSRRRLLWALYGVYLAVTVCLILVGIELVLWCAYLITGQDNLRTLEASGDARQTGEYPGDPQDYLKIAVFGGSAAEGAYSPRSFAQILQHELRRRFPKRRLFVKNYAASGYPFHRHQAELVKMLMDKYDIILIYCGNNEASNWYDDSGYWRIAERKDAKELVFQSPPEAMPRVIQQLRGALEKHSRIYALAFHGRQLAQRAQRPPTWNVNPDFAEFEDGPALPADERKRMIANFQRDLIEIGEMADRRGKEVFLATAASHLTWPPGYSYFANDLSPADRDEWLRRYETGLALLEKNDVAAALASFMAARQLDARVAILNYHIGRCHLQQGQLDRALRFLRDAVDQDGFYMRPISDLHRTAQTEAERFSRLHFVDAVAACDSAVRAGITFDDLFVDICHPSFLGHAVIAGAFLDRMCETAPLAGSTTGTHEHVPLDATWPSWVGSYEDELGVTDQQRALAAMNSILWFFELAHFTAYRQRCYDEVLKKVRQLESRFPGEGDSFRAFALASRARLDILRGDYDLALQRINAAFAMSPTAVRGMLNLDAWNHSIASEFEGVGIVFSRRDSAFILQ